MTLKFKSYVSPSGRCDVQAVYDKGSADLKANFEVAISYLKPLSRDKWRRPQAHKLDKQKKFRDFFEIRFQANKVQQRPIGFFGPGINEFTVVMWLTEKGGKLLPLDWFRTANDRREDIISGRASTRNLTLDGDDNNEPS